MKNFINFILDNGKTITYKNNDVIFNEHDECDRIGFIIKGKVKIYTSSKDSDEIVINLLSENECFGDLLIFSSKPYYYGTAIALVNTTISFLTKQQLITLMQQNSTFLQTFLKNITNKGVELKQKNKLLVHKNIEERVTFYLYNYQSKYCDNCVYFKSITDIANFLSIPRPSLSRTLHQMERDNKIRIEKNKIRLLK